MDTIRSLKEVRKQYKEKALAASKVSAGPKPSPPVSECDYYSTATKYTDDEESKEVESEKDEKEVHSITHLQTLRGSFSSVSTPIFATKDSFCSMFRDLQNKHTFAPLQIQNFSLTLKN